jgi:undecaprenyl-diphosphatase
MKTSLSKKIFLYLNKMHKKHEALNKVMNFFAYYGIVLLGIVVVFSVYIQKFGDDLFGPFVFTPAPLAFLIHDEIFIFSMFFSLSLIIGLIASNLTGKLWPHQRPIMEMSNISQIYEPLSTWKSFPSDHSLIATIFVVLGFIFLLSPIILVTAIVLALLTMIGRVYVGVHYPHDILGGIVYGCVAVYVVYLFL